jgi:hypothetical protein
MAKDTEPDKGKETILPPNPKKSFLDRAPNRPARTIAQIRTGHWLSALFLKRVRKIRDVNISDLCWWCGQFRMSRTHLFLRCTHPDLENARTAIWDRPREDGRKGQRPKSLGQLLGKAKSEKPLGDGITATGVGPLGPERRDRAPKRVERNDGWRRDQFIQYIYYIVYVGKYGGSGSVFDYVRVTIYNGVVLQGELYSRQPSKLVGKLVSKP